MEIIDGNDIAGQIIDELKVKVKEFSDTKPVVLFIRVGEDPASVSYVRKKQMTADKIGIISELLVLSDSITQPELLDKISEANDNPRIHGILIQAPLPPHIDERDIFNHVLPQKDVDGFNATNLGMLCQERDDCFASCTPAGIIEIIKRQNIVTEGKHVVVLGRSLIVGKPVGMLMLKKALPGNSTVTFCHSRTANIENFTQQADILIAAIGKPHFVGEGMVKKGATVIDVGINRIPDQSRKSGYRLVGDVDFEKVAPLCSSITPVPGGVGPMTVAMLMNNTVKAFELSLLNNSKT
ncbi:MAG: bifunctional 5,10-methylenetetrahydrofolate dehydrogenase/5,10-methenyltetrahydrofolate cyclohydrolase [Opitutales bacterium]|nr:bifunctional 5,10-methylenetetrahydrofolate dehydrogenase/5,10-methenyltetrahydrofolate cyclohydrolase [Opitutales bacterium]